MTKNPILMAAVLNALLDLPPSAAARKPGSGQVSQIVGSRGQQLVLDNSKLNAGLPGAADPNDTLKPDENGVVQYVTAQDEMYMACQWLCSLSEEDCAQVLPILRQIKEAYVEERDTGAPVRI